MEFKTISEGLKKAKKLDHAKLVPLYKKSGTKISGRFAIENIEQLKVVAMCTEKYRLIQHEDAMALFLNMLKASGIGDDQVSGRFWQNDVFAVGEMTIKDKEYTLEVEEGDEVGFGIRVVNSYNGRNALKASLYAMRLACSNGLIAKEIISMAYSKHIGEMKAFKLDFTSKLQEAVGAMSSNIRECTEMKCDDIVAALLSVKIPEKYVRRIVEQAYGLEKNFFDKDKKYKEIAEVSKAVSDRDKLTFWQVHSAATYYFEHDYPHSKLAKDTYIARATNLLY